MGFPVLSLKGQADPPSVSFLVITWQMSFQVSPLVATVASETLEGMFLANNSPNTQHRAPKPSAIDFYPGME